MVLKKDFKFGVGTSHTQIEEPCESSWKNIVAKDGSINKYGVKHEKNLETDLKLITDLGVDYYKMSLNWPKLQNAPFGELDPKTVKFYHKMFDNLNDNGVQPNITLHHFDNPSWFDKQGGWLSEQSKEEFIDFSEKAIKEFGQYTDMISTFNEISTYVALAYADGFLPNNNGFKLSPGKLKKAVQNITDTHKVLYEKLKDKTPDKNIGFTEIIRPYISFHDGFLGSVENKLTQNIIEPNIQSIWNKLLDTENGLKTDFAGIQYYGPYAFNVKKLLGTPMIYRETDKNGNSMKHDELWNVDPKYLTQGAKDLKEKHPSLDLYVTENGTCTNDDQQRIEYIDMHIDEMKKNPELFKGYFHWSLLDNFELAEGYSKRFGLVHVDYDNDFKRTPKGSYHHFKDIIKQHKENK
ncbi:family 1 glycosylhydrolase [Candidatus Woesearchaeota archaeon]|nr:family 1 glycosylhydrolase [Candidatus Woesearchaeota archaeon]MCF7900654.1 family 1 glycosylhydrolase [Candidatus Woesearchaeota archaeon]MCF8013511.1 family 1 glycosylhydrolase [Candidatus Woesearchaeota archaeon]